MTIGGYPLILLVGAFAVGTLLMVVLDKAQRRPIFVVAGLLIADGLVPVLQGTAASIATGGTGEGTLVGGQVYLGRVGTLLLYVVLALGLLRPRRVESGAALAFAAMGVGLTTYISLVLATGLLYHESPVRWVLRVLAVYVAWSLKPADVARFVQVLVGGILTISLLGILVRLPWMWRQFEGASQLLPGVPLRFQGLAAHPNGLAPLALLYLILDRVTPAPARLRRLLQAVAVVCLVLTQSKTALLTAVGVLALFVYHDRIKPDEQSKRVLPLAVATAGLVAAVLYFGVVDGAETELVGDQDAVISTGTLVGRSQLWQVGIDAWRQSPVSGAGTEFFRDYAARTQQPWAGQAHNQYVQTLTQYGLVGLAGMLLYVVALLVFAWRLRSHTRQVSIALVGTLLFRSITETPLDTLSLIHLPVLALLMGWTRELSEGDSGGLPFPVAGSGAATGDVSGSAGPVEQIEEGSAVDGRRRASGDDGFPGRRRPTIG